MPRFAAGLRHDCSATEESSPIGVLEELVSFWALGFLFCLMDAMIPMFCHAFPHLHLFIFLIL